ncbi:MAG: sigma-70 family RNA polymerase sigma factor [Microthrixaceae bacterium]
MDENLVRRAQRGDATAMETVVRGLATYLGPICGSIALDQGDDALQEAMVIITRKLDTLREPAALKGWARRIAVREAVRTAGSSRSIPIDPSMLDRTPGLDSSATTVEVRAVLDQLAPQQRAVLVLRHLEGLPEAEMAEILDVAPGTVKGNL